MVGKCKECSFSFLPAVSHYKPLYRAIDPQCVYLFLYSCTFGGENIGFSYGQNKPPNVINPSSPKGGCTNPPNGSRPGAQNCTAKG